MNYTTVVNALTFCILFVSGGILSKSLYADSGSLECAPGWLLDEGTKRCYTPLPDVADLTTGERIHYCWSRYRAYYRYGACVKAGLHQYLTDDRSMADKIPNQWKRAFGNSGFGRK